MLFSSIPFLYYFLPAVLIIYHILLRKWRAAQNVFLLLVSLFFYAWGEPKFVLVMCGSILVNWFFGLLISKNTHRRTFSKRIVMLSVLCNLGILFVFKYLTFTGNIINSLLSADLSIPKIALPIGISFFTFQAMSYVIDVYRQKGEVQTNLLYVGLYIAFFPQLIAGPIVRYETIADEIKHRKETADDFFDGFARFVMGLAKKVLLSNNLGFLADQAFQAVEQGNTISVLFSWLGAVAYAMQIFFDFSGYSDMAIGLGRMFGFHFLENFNYPYISRSISEFWRRWHISLGTWFRDYLYIPLGGNRVSKARNIRNLFAVWFLTGLWHGANWTFIAWGLMYFVLLSVEKVTGFDKLQGTAASLFQRCYTLLFVLLGWVLFRSNSIALALEYMQSMFGLNGNAFSDGLFMGWFSQNMILLAVGAVLCTPVFRKLNQKTENCEILGYLKVIGLFLLFVLSVANLLGSSYNPFIYFNF
jgi:D-alanyl-lipoteichoic acid acyltransferase DltB (MBOAT superfamily)